MTDDDALITLDEAAKLIPGADADTLKRMHRAGKLVCYKPGKKLLTTAANVGEAVRTNYRATPLRAPSGQPDAASMERSRAALDLVLSRLPTKPKKAARAKARPPRRPESK
ncbi:hypothetical protein IVB45_20780 [Bradyrhizobium sp. 4]|uniref:hypothetical protein n=1 Tax=unclassified Bradyrhizobium TaxID=2631580 RepID=UPI001FFABAFB|nr:MULTISPECIES: hypothetical protein [unclassified Bradyrhizobium]MCK1402337.1 hypothetical protein [Bradyrhizobium sp. 39]MCK1747932.1 hypothetical protein [Bradyrhizobium sp. 135]UPJ32425.1 hypothetical protein IVB45_20780 [Bradyrhizobium sp. 4]